MGQLAEFDIIIILLFLVSNSLISITIELDGVARVTEDFSLPPMKTSFSAGMVMDEEPLESIGNTLFLDLENLIYF